MIRAGSVLKALSLKTSFHREKQSMVLSSWDAYDLHWLILTSSCNFIKPSPLTYWLPRGSLPHIDDSYLACSGSHDICSYSTVHLPSILSFLKLLPGPQPINFFINDESNTHLQCTKIALQHCIIPNLLCPNPTSLHIDWNKWCLRVLVTVQTHDTVPWPKQIIEEAFKWEFAYSFRVLVHDHRDIKCSNN